MPLKPKIEHLKFIQAVIARMGANSLLLKGWTVTLVAALFAFGANGADRVFIVIVWAPVLVFAGLDAYLLRRERLYRLLHDKVAAQADMDMADFILTTREFRSAATWRGAIASGTILGFYLPVAGLPAVLTVYVALAPKGTATQAQRPKTITISIQ